MNTPQAIPNAQPVFRRCAGLPDRRLSGPYLRANKPTGSRGQSHPQKRRSSLVVGLSPRPAGNQGT